MWMANDGNYVCPLRQFLMAQLTFAAGTKAFHPLDEIQGDRRALSSWHDPESYWTGEL